MTNENDKLLSELYEQYYARLKNYCLIIFQYDPRLVSFADDCVQETFIKALEHKKKVASAPSAYAWLAKCCRNTCISMQRRRTILFHKIGKQVAFDETNEHPDSTDSIIRWLYQYQAKELLAEIYAQLTPLEQAIFYDYFQNKMSTDQVAVHNSTSIYSVKGALQRIRKKAQKVLREFYSEP